MWTKRTNHAPKNERARFFNICPKRAVLKKLSLTICLSSLVFIFSLPPPPKKTFKKHYNSICLPWPHGHLVTRMDSCLFLPRPLFYLSHYKTPWTMSGFFLDVDNVGLKTCLLGIMNSMITLPFFSWCKPKWYRDEFNNHS
jgi:hypothetical protein